MSDQQKDAAPTSAQVKAWYWPWIVGGLVVWIYLQRTDIQKLQEKNDALQEARLKDKDDLAASYERQANAVERNIAYSNRIRDARTPDSTTGNNQSGPSGQARPD